MIPAAISLAPPTAARLLGSWSFDPFLCAVLACAAGVYLLAMTRVGRHWPLWRAGCWLGGLATLGVALMSGVDGYAELLLSVHMLQHMLLLLLAPALLLWAAPVRLALGASPQAGRRALGALLRGRWLRLASRPAVGFALLAVVVLGTHLTGLFELALRDQTVHTFEHAAYFWSGVLFLAPILACDPLPHPPSGIARFSWLMAAMAVMAVPGALLTFATGVRYPHYLAPARALGRSALADQQLAGVIMWIGGGVVVFALALGVAMQAMLAEERRQRRRESYA